MGGEGGGSWEVGVGGYARWGGVLGVGGGGYGRRMVLEIDSWRNMGRIWSGCVCSYGLRMGLQTERERTLSSREE